MSLNRQYTFGSGSHVMFGRVRPLSLEIAASDDTILDLDVLKVHCSVDGDALDDLLGIYERAAIQWAEDEMHRTLLARSHTFVISDFPRFPNSQQITLPRGICQSVNSIQYVQDGETITLSGPSSGSPGGTDFQEDLGSINGARLLPVQGSAWPSCDDNVIKPVAITYTAGWNTAASIPANIKHALMFAVADMLEVRGVTDLVTLAAVAASGKTFDARLALIGRYIINRVY
jgi:uncharacterized phiE125 gp8 family phage protein